MSPITPPVRIHDLFIIADEPQRRRLIARVESFDWPSAIGLEVIIVGGGERFSARQIAFGNVEGFATVELALTKAIDESEARLRVLLENKTPMELRLA